MAPRSSLSNVAVTCYHKIWKIREFVGCSFVSGVGNVSKYWRMGPNKRNTQVRLLFPVSKQLHRAKTTGSFNFILPPNCPCSTIPPQAISTIIMVFETFFLNSLTKIRFLNCFELVPSIPPDRHPTT